MRSVSVCMEYVETDSENYLKMGSPTTGPKTVKDSTAGWIVETGYTFRSYT